MQENAVLQARVASVETVQFLSQALTDTPADGQSNSRHASAARKRASKRGRKNRMVEHPPASESSAPQDSGVVRTYLGDDDLPPKALAARKALQVRLLLCF